MATSLARTEGSNEKRTRILLQEGGHLQRCAFELAEGILVAGGEVTVSTVERYSTPELMCEKRLLILLDASAVSEWEAGGYVPSFLQEWNSFLFTRLSKYPLRALSFAVLTTGKFLAAPPRGARLLSSVLALYGASAVLPPMRCELDPCEPAGETPSRGWPEIALGRLGCG